jgi:hypothetical protein
MTRFLIFDAKAGEIKGRVAVNLDHIVLILKGVPEDGEDGDLVMLEGGRFLIGGFGLIDEAKRIAERPLVTWSLKANP